MTKQDEFIGYLEALINLLKEHPEDHIIVDFSLDKPYSEAPTDVHDQVKKYHQPETFISIRILNKTEYNSIPKK